LGCSTVLLKDTSFRVEWSTGKYIMGLLIYDQSIVRYEVLMELKIQAIVFWVLMLKH